MALTYEPIATSSVVGTGGANFTFSSIPSTYNDLCIIITGSTNGSNAVRMQFNSDTGTNYAATRLFGDGASAFGNASVGQTFIDLSVSTFWDSAYQAFSKIDILNYSNAAIFKNVLITNSRDANGSGRSGVTVGLWRSNSAISSIFLHCANVSADFSNGTMATLYGIKAA